MSTGELILYQTEDGLTKISLRAINGIVWLSQLEIAELFATTKQNVSLHIQNIFEQDELLANSVVKESLITAADGKQYNIKLYNLDTILAVGYRVRSPRGAQFRRWANSVLKEYLVKGFAMHDEHLKQAGQWDYFDEWVVLLKGKAKLLFKNEEEIYLEPGNYVFISAHKKHRISWTDPNDVCVWLALHANKNNGPTRTRT